MVVVAQLVRASDCGSEGRGFESRLPPQRLLKPKGFGSFLFITPLEGGEFFAVIDCSEEAKVASRRGSGTF